MSAAGVSVRSEKHLFSHLFLEINDLSPIYLEIDRLWTVVPMASGSKKCEILTILLHF